MSQMPESLALNDGFEERIRQLQTDQYRILKECMDAKRSGDPQQEDAAGLKLINSDRELRGLMKAEALRFAGEISGADRKAEDEKIAQLLVAFVRGTRLARLWRDVVLERRVAERRGRRVAEIHQTLIDHGRVGDLEILLDHSDMSVRATVASWLLPLMPERCLAVLKEVKAKSHLTDDAGGKAFWALELWQEAQKRAKAESAAG